LEKGSDDLAQWSSRRTLSGFFISTDDSVVIDHYREIASWVYEQGQFKDEAKAEFSQNADGWLLACVKAKEMVLVPHEVFSPDVRKKVPMPNVCREFGVDYLDTFQMLRELGVRFHWKPIK
jgi:hypothetical protein